MRMVVEEGWINTKGNPAVHSYLQVGSDQSSDLLLTCSYFSAVFSLIDVNMSDVDFGRDPFLYNFNVGLL